MKVNLEELNKVMPLKFKVKENAPARSLTLTEACVFSFFYSFIKDDKD